MNFDRIYLLPKISKIQISFSLIGILFYFSIIILFFFYYNSICFIKEEIFSFILLKSVFSLIELFIENDNFRTIFIYISEIILFYLLLIHINKCFTQKKIIEDIKDLEINDKTYILLIFMLSIFPFEYYFKLQIAESCAQNVIKIILIAFLYNYINKRIKLMIERLTEQKIKSKIDINYMPGSKENYYLKMIRTINSMYLAGIILFIIFFSIKIYLLFNYNEIVEYFGNFADYTGLAFIILAELLFFFCSNKLELEKGIRKDKINNNIRKFVVIKIFNQDDLDENINF